MRGVRLTLPPGSPEALYHAVMRLSVLGACLTVCASCSSMGGAGRSPTGSDSGTIDGSSNGGAAAASGGRTGTGNSGASGRSSSGSAGASSSGGDAAQGGTGGAGGPGASGDADGATGNTVAGGGATDIGTWTDAPGQCPAGTTQVDITQLSELEGATRGEGRYASDPPGVCYLVHDGTYQQSGGTLPMYIQKGGVDATHQRVFVGQSRGGVVVRGRATVDAGVSHVRISNLTFDLTGFSQSGSFNTVTLLAGNDLVVDHVTFTGDCKTGANGGHVEVDGASGVLVEACIIEKFGRCGPDGHQDHGVYLASGKDITLRDNDIRGNASRGIQFNTEGGNFGTLDGVTIERNRVHDNGHADYEDGIVMNATGTGKISNVVVQNNLIYANYYSGLRESGAVFESISIRDNTFFHDGAASSGAGRSELNLDSAGSGASTVVTRNVIVAASAFLNDCYDSKARNYVLEDNVVQGSAPGGSGDCVSGSVTVNPMFADASAGDFHANAAAVSGYGAYAP